MRLTWNVVGSRYYELGVDHGVLYIEGQPGVAWPGLISISESPSGGAARAYYVDGVKFLNISSSEEFEATLEAYSSPLEFGPCDGTVSIQNGLFVTQQPRKSFHLSYRTKIGNDISEEHGYKIHLVYNALAAPSRRNNSTLGASVSPVVHSWNLTTLPPPIVGYKRTSHFVVDSRYTEPSVMEAIEDILYGSEVESPRIPNVDELIDIFAN